MKRHALLLATSVGMFAAATACGPDGQAPPTTASSLADSADQVIFGLSTHITEEGIRVATLDSDTAFMFDEGSRLELRNLQLTFYDAQGVQDALLTAQEGTRNTRTDEMEARGDVVLVTEDGRRLMTEQLRYDQAGDQISSDSAFVSIENGRRLEGIGFRANSDLSRWQCLQACRAGGAVNLPAESGGQREAPPAPLDTSPPR